MTTLSRTALLLVGLSVLVGGEPVSKCPPLPGDSFYEREIDYVASLKSRLTGSANHTTFIDYLESELTKLGFTVHSDDYTFEYNTPPSTPLELNIEGQPVDPSSYVPYSGNTDADGVSGRLVPVTVPNSPALSPNWSVAAGNIAIVNLYNSPLDGPGTFPLWPGFDDFGTIHGIPSVNEHVRNMTAAAAAGVRGIIYNWMNVTDLNAFGQYGPFKNNYQGVPAIYATNQALEQAGARNGSLATITSTGKLLQDVGTRTLYVVIKGTSASNESLIINTHTDGTNAVEENGHIPLLAKARELAAHPPRRTVVLVFLSGHLHTSGFTEKGRVMARWMADHSELWDGNTPGALKAVFGSCVEHLGAMRWEEDLPNNSYYPTDEIEDEWLFTNTPELAEILTHTWRHAPKTPLRVINPHLSPLEQSGEGLPLVWNNIPEVSLCTSPEWLLKEFPGDFDETLLMDKRDVKRQTENFLRLWNAVDQINIEKLGESEWEE